MPNCTLSVSPCTTVTCSMGMPSRCETSWAKVVSWPWPWLCEPVSTSTEPVGLTRTSADSHRPTPAPSEPTACARRDAAGLDVGGEAEAALHAVLGALRLARADALVVGQLQRLVEAGVVVAGVVGHDDGRRRAGSA